MGQTPRTVSRFTPQVVYGRRAGRRKAFALPHERSRTFATRVPVTVCIVREGIGDSIDRLELQEDLTYKGRTA